jgi:dTDP-D-glucose 4,6-dehydratase
MNIDDMKHGDLKAIAAMFGGQSQPQSSAYKVGEKRMFRTVTHIITGEIVSIHSDGVIVRDAAWIADTGRYADAVAKSTFSEVEPYPDGAEVVVNLSAMIDSCIISDLPRVQK